MGVDGMTVDGVRKDAPQPVVGIVLAALDALLVVGLLTFAAPCAYSGGSDVSSCHWAFRAVLAVAAVLGILAIVRIFEPDEGERRGLSLACGLLGVLVAAMPGFVIGLCGDPSMACNVAMRPFCMGIGACIALVGGVDLTLRLIAAFRH